MSLAEYRDRLIYYAALLLAVLLCIPITLIAGPWAIAQWYVPFLIILMFVAQLIGAMQRAREPVDLDQEFVQLQQVQDT